MYFEEALRLVLRIEGRPITSVPEVVEEIK